MKAAREKRSYIEGNPHKIINGFLIRNVSGQVKWMTY